jgi:hypothetical protein
MIGNAYRLPLLALGMISLFSALWGGLLRLGLSLPSGPPALAGFHGPLMISGFLGTLIGLERAVALGKSWAYGVPVLSGAGALSLLFGLPGSVSASLMILSSLILVFLFLNVYLRQPAFFTLVMGAGAMLWLFGNVLWLNELPLYRVVLWWGGFLVLTISGERLELARLGFLSGRSRISFQIALAVFLAGLVVSLKLFDSGVRLTGIGLIFLSIWLLTYDIARRTIRQRGLTRFIAASLLLGHLWLGVAGVLALWFGGNMAGFSYDAVLHSLFLGFVFSMIFGHAPIIFPAILGIPLMYHPRFYIHLSLLHLTLILRIGSDLAEWGNGRKWGGLLNGMVIVLFLANTVYSLFRSRMAPHPLRRKE